MTDDAEIYFKDFTVPRRRVVFRVAPDEFECVPALPPDALQEMMTKFRGADFADAIKSHNVEHVMNGIRDIFKIFILDEHYDVFLTRMSDRRNPVDTQQLLQIVQWIIEVYTKRPTEPSQSSSTGSLDGDAGTSSAGGAALDELLRSNSLPPTS